MVSAPPVSYPVGRSGLYGRLVWAMLALGLVSEGYWLTGLDEWHPWHIGAAGLSLLLWLWALRDWARPVTGLLRWDGQAWSLQCGQQAQQVGVRVVLDLQHHLLLTLRPVQSSGRVQWVWPESRTQPEHWLALRQALFAT